jgi:GTPase SAR1 family protein
MEANMDVADLNQLADLLAKQGVLRRVDSSGNVEELPMDASLKAAKKHERHENWVGQLIRARQLSDLAAMPIIGVMGQLNVGKSSVVASFLSEQGKNLIPRGTMNAKGTHRFVYWIPESWKTGERWQTLEKMLAQVHGSKMEHMHREDPEAVSMQYQAGLKDMEVMRVPLIGFDESLNQLQCAFLDCPDVQTRDQVGDDSLPRMAIVRAAARICSVFLLIWERKQVTEKLLDEFLQLLRDQCPGVPIHLLLNKLSGDNEPNKTLQDPNVQKLLNTYNLGGNTNPCFYGAFDFGNTQALKQEPEVFQNWRKQGWEFPGFFKVDQSLLPYDPEKIGNERMLLSLPKQLKSGELQAQQLSDSLIKLPEEYYSNWQELSEWSKQENQETEDLRRDLYKFCKQIFTHDARTGKFSFNQDFEDKLRKSFIRNAPSDVEWVSKLSSPIHYIRPKLAYLKNQLFKRLPIGQNSNATTKEKATEQLNLEDIFNKAKACPCFNEVIAEGKEDLLRKALKSILEDFQNWVIKEIPDEEELDKLTQQFWSNADQNEISKAKGKIWVELFVSMLSYLSLLGAAVDGGATYLTLTWAHHISGLGLLAAGLSLGAGGSVFIQYFNTKSFHQFQKFYSFACSRLGLPSQIPEELEDSTSNLETYTPPPAQPILSLGPDYYWEILSKPNIPISTSRTKAFTAKP